MTAKTKVALQSEGVLILPFGPLLSIKHNLCLVRKMSSVSKPPVSVAVQKSSFYTFLVNLICVPAICRFLGAFFANASERLDLDVEPVKFRKTFGKKNENNNEYPQSTVMRIHKPFHFCWVMLLDPKIGLGESYMAGDWSVTPNPTEFLRLLIRAKKQTTNARAERSGPREKSLSTKLALVLLEALRGAVKVIYYAQHWLHENTVIQSTKNIQAHYDLGNDMFKLFLDKTMTYSCGIFEDSDVNMPVKGVDFDKLEEAQKRKIDTLLDQLELGPDDHVLEIGCGWGAAAIRGVQRSGCKWTGITISREQLDWARGKVAEAGLESRINLEFQDYRLVQGTFTRIVSIEMIEAVGEKFLPQYFQIINDRLTDNGIAAIQAIICPDAYYDRYRSSSDFIKKYIFPGGHLPSLGAIEESVPPTLKPAKIASYAHHYSTTLQHWYWAWMDAEKKIEEFNYPSDFHRRWQFYFCLCAALFSSEHIDVVQICFHKGGSAKSINLVN
ncbi:unnamed protein product [Caenorhabditis auriculariae]|uniref:Cyclopropane-fatty-acyl-phospholipid synthase n=1 Tax=Caenorhabditis auriculariae TaxID=2777116 RepID=A0A8S1HDQ6_9PELO|nr:unnamed protein product [Caenorhabditis auriculariae]